MSGGDEPGPKMVINLDLSDAELHSIGRIVAYWGRLENEVFEQSALSFDDSEDVPKALLNNLKFSDVLKLWKERVVGRAEGERRSVLEAQHAKIEHYQQFRAPVVHAMWDWDKADPSVIISRRVAKNQIHEIKFTSADLARMALELGEILYWVSYPGGIDDYAQELTEVGGHMSRSFYASITGHPQAEEFLPAAVRKALKDSGGAK